MGFPIYYFTGAEGDLKALGADGANARAIVAALTPLDYPDIAGRLAATPLQNLYVCENTFHREAETVQLGLHFYRSYPASSSTVVVTFGWAPPPRPALPGALWILGAFRETPGSNRLALLNRFVGPAQAAEQTQP